MSAPSTPNPPDIHPVKKGLHPMAIIGIGCGGISLILLIAVGFMVAKGVKFLGDAYNDPMLAVAQIAISANPDLDVVDSDTEKGIIRVKVKSTGEIISVDRSQFENGHFSFTKMNPDGTEEVVDMDFSDAADGNISISNAEGDTLFETGSGTSENIPDWVPDYPGDSDIKGTFNMSIGDGKNGSFTITTADSVQKFADTYQPILEKAGFTVTSQGITQNGESTQMILTGKNSSNDQVLNLIIIPTKEGTTIQATYSNKM